MARSFSGWLIAFIESFFLLLFTDHQEAPYILHCTTMLDIVGFYSVCAEYDCTYDCMIILFVRSFESSKNIQRIKNVR